MHEGERGEGVRCEGERGEGVRCEGERGEGVRCEGETDTQHEGVVQYPHLVKPVVTVLENVH